MSYYNQQQLSIGVLPSQGTPTPPSIDAFLGFQLADACCCFDQDICQRSTRKTPICRRGTRWLATRIPFTVRSDAPQQSISRPSVMEGWKILCFWIESMHQAVR
ncbi:unnamed protein product [Musa acuminata subsp. malaccensis]|uniref:(wild Malaysian banana) hypothetical protein n=1 Tax=Musa acuminata subsp. malaccensis TaxID=214687 RepID=A0A804IPK9_MUSAM|nr:unnamed protein product [Musa acuminata subsp. malaccensis]